MHWVCIRNLFFVYERCRLMKENEKKQRKIIKTNKQTKKTNKTKHGK